MEGFADLAHGTRGGRQLVDVERLLSQEGGDSLPPGALVPHRKLERRHLEAVLGMYAGSLRHKEPCDREVTIACSQVQGRVLVVVGRTHVGAPVEQQRDCPHVPALHRCMDGC